jgi:hypothetical protein
MESLNQILVTDLSVDLRDVVGDRLFLSKGFRRDGVRSSISMTRV